MELKDCPFCGAEAEFTPFEYGDHNSGNDFTVRCTGPEGHRLDHVGPKEELIPIWNSRASLDMIKAGSFNLYTSTRILSFNYGDDGIR